jgi:hypothetical protein
MASTGGIEPTLISIPIHASARIRFTVRQSASTPSISDRATTTLQYNMAPREGFEPPYYALRPLRLVNSQVSYQLEYLGIKFGGHAGIRTPSA